MTEIVKYNVYVDTNYVGSQREGVIEIDVTDIPEEEREAFIEEECRQWMFENINWGYEKA